MLEYKQSFIYLHIKTGYNRTGKDCSVLVVLNVEILDLEITLQKSRM